jgi:hypothetical protein
LIHRSLHAGKATGGKIQGFTVPLALPPMAIGVITDAPVVVSDAAPFAGADAQPVALLALTSFRAPPSR